MFSNPFMPSEAFLQMPLSEEMYQRIHAVALRRAVQGYSLATFPDRARIEYLRQQVQKKGPEVCLEQPVYLAALFTGVTFGVYRAIEALYCSRIGRSIPMVCRILKAMAQEAQAPPIDNEAVWAICVYLEKQRKASTDVSIERRQEYWQIGNIRLDLDLLEPNGVVHKHPCLLYVVDLQQLHLLSFRVVSEERLEQHAMLTLYDALCSQRRPYQRALTGILWHLPKQIATDIPLTPDGYFAFRKLGIAVTTRLDTPPPGLLTLLTTWASGVAGRLLHLDQCISLLDHYLEKTSGQGPLRFQAQRDHKYAYLVGYPQDPEWLFPLLRTFLPEHPAKITLESIIEYDHLHYADDLLSYFVDYSVVVRPSVYSEAQVWVYLEGEILCPAMARELRRRDGTYRRSRPGR
jgi:hypothetical protein